MESPPRDPSAATSASDPPIIFRPKKKRPTLRSRNEEHDADATSPRAATGNGVASKAEKEDDDQDVSVAEVLRQRRKQARLRGSGLAPEQMSTRGAGGDDGGEQSVVEAGERRAKSPDAVLGAISSRFAPQTGLVGELVNKHMNTTHQARMEYVESKLASRHATSGPQQTSPSPSADTRATSAGPAEAHKPAVQGKLMEVDLGEEARSRNVELTERARRKLAGEPAPEEDDAEPSGKASKKMRSARERNRRGSDAERRDQLVEKFLHENRPDLNIPIEEAPPPPQDPSDTPADDRIAEEFKREFLDAIASRRQKRRAAKPPARPGDRRAGDGDVLKGPKLGGSRNVRSAVRDILLQQEKEREKEKAKGRMRR